MGVPSAIIIRPVGPLTTIPFVTNALSSGQEYIVWLNWPHPKHFRSFGMGDCVCWKAFAPGFMWGGMSRTIGVGGGIDGVVCTVLDQISFTLLLMICLEICCRTIGFIIMSPITGSK